MEPKAVFAAGCCAFSRDASSMQNGIEGLLVHERLVAVAPFIICCVVIAAQTQDNTRPIKFI
jgi:hypothetical protein